MPEERKSAPLPPLPWRIEYTGHYNGWIVADAKDRALAVCWHSGCGDAAEAVADLFCRAPALEKDNALLLASVTDQVDTERAQLADGVCDWMALEAERDDANMQANANNEVAASLHEQLKDARTRLESTEAALRDAQESRFALIVQNEELGAELAATRARLESIEKQRDDLRAVLRKAGCYVDLCGIRAGRNVSDATIDLSRRIVAVLRATRERSEG